MKQDASIHEMLRGNFENKISLTDAEFETASGFFKPKNLRRHQYLVQAGDVCRYTAFVCKGLLQNYFVDEQGEEHVIAFASEDWWIGDIASFVSGNPSLNNVDALEDSELLVMERADFEKMFSAVPKLERFFRIQLQNNLVALQRRMQITLSLSAEMRYSEFLKTYPTLAQRIPQHRIASFLGITPETLSRVRKHALR